MDQVAQHRLFLDDARVVLDVGDAGHAIRERGEIGSAAGGVQFAAAVEFFGEGDEVDGLLGFAEGNHRVKTLRCWASKEIVGLEGLNGGVQRVVVEQDGAEDGTLSVEIAGQRTFESGISGHRGQRGLSLFRFSFAIINCVLRNARRKIFRRMITLEPELQVEVCADLRRASIGVAVNRKGNVGKLFCEERN